MSCKTATQQMISDALSALQTAVSGLSVDITALLGLIAEVEQIDPSLYTQQSYNALQPVSYTHLTLPTIRLV